MQKLATISLERELKATAQKEGTFIVIGSWWNISIFFLSLIDKFWDHVEDHAQAHLEVSEEESLYLKSYLKQKKPLTYMLFFLVCLLLYQYIFFVDCFLCLIRSRYKI